MHMKHSIIMILISALFLLLYTAKGIITLDSDFGWHIRMGQIILYSGIPKTDPFSYTMPSYPFVDHEWLTNVAIAAVYPVIGMTGLAVLFAILVAAAIYIQIPSSLYRLSALPIILIAAALFPVGGIRTQVITWFLFSFMVWIISRHSRGAYYRYAPLGIMLIWSNLHGAFPIGLVILSTFYITRWIERKKNSLQELGILTGAFAVTFINPYGYRLWWEVWMQMSDSSLHFTILEWLPAFFFVNIALWMYVVISSMITFRYRSKFSLFQKSIYLLFLLAGISTFRHMPLWIIVSLYPTLLALKFFYAEVSKYKFGKERVRSFYLILVGLALFCLIWQLGWYFSGTSQKREDRDYPKNAIVYIKKNLPKGQIFTPYEWGGYLDWKLPEKKVFIDGRMPSFRWKQAKKDESSYIFKEYQKAMYGNKKDFTAIMKKYSVEMVLMPRQDKSMKSVLDRAFAKFLAQYKNADHKPKENKFEDFDIVYQDRIAIVYTIQKDI